MTAGRYYSRGGSFVALTFFLLAAPALPQESRLGEPPRLPIDARQKVESGSSAPRAASHWVDITNREAVRQLYQTAYQAVQTVPFGWSGNVAAGNAGTTSAEYKNAVITLVNYFRSMAGVPGITHDPELSRKAQLAALMMAAQQQLSHTPPMNWPHFTADGAEAAQRSNLCLSSNLKPGCVELYIEDRGASNAPVGHRRWILHPQTRRMGTGDIPPGQGGPLGANALWVINPEEVFGPRPATRQDFISWPPPGFVPESLVFPRWSFSFPNATFTNATVTMSRNGAPVPLQILPMQQGFGENTIVWEPQATAGPTASREPREIDVTTRVTVSNVVINNVAREFTYNVISFNPAEAATPAITAAGTVNAGSYQGGTVSPGEILVVFGQNIGPGNLAQFQLQNGRLPTQLGGTRILFDGAPAPMIYTVAGQSSVIAPFSLAGKQNVTIRVEVNGVLSNAVNLPVAPTKPGIFTLDQTGSGPGAILNQDFSVNGPANRARRGSVVQIFMTGGGVLSTPGVDGAVSPPVLNPLAAQVSVTIGGAAAQVQYAGVAPALLYGVVQVNVFVPQQATSGPNALRITINGVTSPAGPTVSVE